MTWMTFERRWLALVFAAILPGTSDPRFPDGAERLGAERYIDSLLRSAPSGFCIGLRVCTWLLMLAPPFVLGRRCSFAALLPAERSELLERLTCSDTYLIRELPMLFKTAACLGLCGLADVQRRIGIRPVDATPPDWAGKGARAAHLPIAKEERP